MPSLEAGAILARPPDPPRADGTPAPTEELEVAVEQHWQHGAAPGAVHFATSRVAKLVASMTVTSQCCCAPSCAAQAIRRAVSARIRARSSNAPGFRPRGALSI